MAGPRAAALLPICSRDFVFQTQSECYPAPTPVNTISDIGEERAIEDEGQLRLQHDQQLVYPSPTSGEVKIILPEGKTANIVVSNSFGKICVETKIVSTAEINLKNLVNGLYIIKVCVENAAPVSHKVLLIK